MASSQPTPPSPTVTTSSSRKQAAPSFAGRVNQFRNYLSAGNNKNLEPPVLPAQEASSVVGRAQRLDLVKPELLSEKSKNGTFMKGHQRSLTQDLNPKPPLHATLPPADQNAHSSTAFDNSQVQEPVKAFLKRNTIGKMVLGSRSSPKPADDEEKLIEKSAAVEEDARTFVFDRKGPVPLIKTADGGIKPLSGWRAKLFWPSSKKGSR